jgi:DNA (cytosine-5)-methyltransferase 1
MRLLDLFCGAGGAAMGYHRAGFEVVGVDIKPQPHYPFTFIQADALEYVAEHGREFDAIHASPPCQRYSSATRVPTDHPDLYGVARTALVATGLPYVIENVIGAPYDHGVVLCGSMFPLSGVIDSDGRPVWVQRHRNFETSWFAFQRPCDHDEYHRIAGRPVTVTGHGNGREGETWREYKHSRKAPTSVWPALMGMPWMRDHPHDVRLSIPPAYTEWIGRQLIAALETK